MTLVLTNANLIDCVRPGVLAGARVTIEGGRIVAVSDGSGPIAGGAQVIDLGGGYLLPGLWDVHVHLEWPRLPAATVAELTVQYAANATRGLVESGVTAIRTAGVPHFIDVALKRAYAGLRLGAHTVEHGYIMDDECLALFRERQAWYVPTLGITHLTPAQATTPQEKRWVEQRGLTADIITRAEDAVPEHRAWFQKALRSGVKMALGSDLRPLRDSALLEMGLWVRDGATPWETLLAATRHAADLCGALADLGTVEVGKLADLIVVREDPLEDIHNLRSLQHLLNEGRFVSDHRLERR